ncbi:hypothetical protein [Corynebacterium aquilae]|uniref:Tail assembly chaperone n=1 Tax=Corynebacterium aquilae DSM 44791 TaxID=1431546 RepID=A0A1L7CF59_9CORY|nr:hypothetical protein [Corynebacterium aquilae]APT84510.1 hypothetical protein CAQU_04930 [Corynebacterium aquilae DSM 44791]
MATKKTTDDRTENYEYTADDGTVITVPWLDTVIDAGTMRRVRKLDLNDQMWTLLEEFAEPDELEKVDALSLAEVPKFFRGWEKGLEVALGESKRR